MYYFHTELDPIKSSGCLVLVRKQDDSSYRWGLRASFLFPPWTPLALRTRAHCLYLLGPICTSKCGIWPVFMKHSESKQLHKKKGLHVSSVNTVEFVLLCFRNCTPCSWCFLASPEPPKVSYTVSQCQRCCFLFHTASFCYLYWTFPIPHCFLMHTIVYISNSTPFHFAGCSVCSLFHTISLCALCCMFPVSYNFNLHAAPYFSYFTILACGS